MLLREILDINRLKDHIKDGYITVREHPQLPLYIYNYSDKTQWEGVWDDITLKCRGLVVDAGGQVIARGFRKFFNYGQKEVVDLNTSGPVYVTDKADGSLCIVAFYYTDLVVATRGSFESEQAKFAYNLIQEKYFNEFRILCAKDSTALAEIIYPENRIVVDYGDMRDLILIGVQSNVEQSNGRLLWTPADQIYSWPGPKVKRFDCDSFEDALRLPPRDNAEGIVIYFENTGERLKLKYPDYLRLHKIISHVNQRTIWESLATGMGVEEIIADIPDEFHKYVRDVSTQLLQQFNSIMSEIATSFSLILQTLPSNWTRKDFADNVKTHKYKTQLFLMLDGKTDRMIESIWKQIQPKGDDHARLDDE